MMQSLISRLTIPASEQHVADVRAWVRHQLDGHQASDDVVLCCDELIANSIQHTNSHRVTIELWNTSNGIRGEVRDIGGDSAPHVKPAAGDSEATGGRGLMIVSAMASEWGTGPDNGGQLTYFVITSPKERAAVRHGGHPTPEQEAWRSRILDRLRQGTTLKDASRAAGIANSTVNRHRQLDPHFDQEVAHARVEGTARVVETMIAGLRQVADWDAVSLGRG